MGCHVPERAPGADSTYSLQGEKRRPVRCCHAEPRDLDGETAVRIVNPHDLGVYDVDQCCPACETRFTPGGSISG